MLIYYLVDLVDEYLESIFRGKPIYMRSLAFRNQFLMLCKTKVDEILFFLHQRMLAERFYKREVVGDGVDLPYNVIPRFEAMDNLI